MEVKQNVWSELSSWQESICYNATILASFYLPGFPESSRFLWALVTWLAYSDQQCLESLLQSPPMKKTSPLSTNIRALFSWVSMLGVPSPLSTNVRDLFSTKHQCYGFLLHWALMLGVPSPLLNCVNSSFSKYHQCTGSLLLWSPRLVVPHLLINNVRRPSSTEYQC